MTDPVAPGSRKTSWLYLGLFLVLVAGLVTAVIYRPKPVGNGSVQPSEAIAAARANARGIGHMEQFNYGPAIEAFEEATKLFPVWITARTNLGIALLNTQVPANLDRALEIFADILRDEPDNIHAHYCSAIILLYRNDLPNAHRMFTRVTELDPHDAYSWYYRGQTRPDEPTNSEAIADYRKALERNPYLNTARYALFLHTADETARQKILTEWESFKNAGAAAETEIKYSKMGPYAEVISTFPSPPPATGATPLFVPREIPLADASQVDDSHPSLRSAVEARFGRAVVVLDFNADGRPDLFIAGAWNRLLRNDGGETFTDVTAEIGLPQVPGALGVAVGDFDNDGYPDLALSHSAGVRLLRNNQGKGFEDKTQQAGLDAVTSVCLGMAWVDLDQDGDLDLVLASYAETPDQALGTLQGAASTATGRLIVFANVGEAPPVPPGQPRPPLTCKFERQTWPDTLQVTGAVVNIVITDLDSDLDLDLVVLIDAPGDTASASVAIINDRLMRFRKQQAAAPWTAARMNGGLVLDSNADDAVDYMAIRTGQVPEFDLNGPVRSTRTPLSDSPPLRQAMRCDLDLDGRTDVLGLGTQGELVYLRGDGSGPFRHRPGAVAPEGSHCEGFAVADFTGNGQPDVITVAGNACQLHANQGNGNQGVFLRLTGRRDPATSMRTNADGIGTRVFAHAGALRSGVELTSLSAGLGQSSPQVHLGIGRESAADAVRVRWPDQVMQAELNVPTGQRVEIAENNRMPSSCPVLFTWDGRRFTFVTDALGAGAVGEVGPDGVPRPPRPEESIKIEPGQLAQMDGRYVLKLTEPMDEVMYLDWVRLTVIDHPADMVVYPDERFATQDPAPTQALRMYKERYAPTRAVDHRGRDVTEALQQRDRHGADGFAVRAWLGYAEDHHVEMTFPPIPKNTQGYDLVLAGWTDYAFPEAIYAATQAGVPMRFPVVEQRLADGTWLSLGEPGFPAGLSRVMVWPLPAAYDPQGGPLRIRTNLQITWDQVFVAARQDGGQVHELDLEQARLAFRGIAQEIRPDGRGSVAYDHDRIESVNVTRWQGRLTRQGDVTPLLRAIDDQHVIAGPGDEVTISFDARSLPPLAAGWVRSFVLRTAGYCKDAAPTTLTGGRVMPIPYRAMPGFPYDPALYPEHLAEYDRTWNTRPAVGGR